MMPSPIRLPLALVAVLLALAACSEKPQPLPDGVAVLERTITWSDQTLEVLIAKVSPDVFAQTQVLLGRGFLDSEYEGPSTPATIVSYAFWQELGADPALLGQEIEVTSGKTHTVVGIAPPGFGSIEGIDLFSPAVLSPRER
jgi:hypothetical protein